MCVVGRCVLHIVIYVVVRGCGQFSRASFIISASHNWRKYVVPLYISVCAPFFLDL